MSTKVKEEVKVNESIDRFIIDNFLFFPENNISKITSYLGMFLISKSSIFSFNIEGKRKTLNIIKSKEMSTDKTPVYEFKYHNKSNGYRVFYKRYVTYQAIYDLYVESIKIMNSLG